MYQSQLTGQPSQLYVLNAKLETVFTIGTDQCTYNHEQDQEACHGNLLCAWSPESTLIASAERCSQRHVGLCWHPDELQACKEAAAAQVSTVLAECVAGEALQYLTWSSCDSLAAATIVYKDDDRWSMSRHPCMLHVLICGQPSISMKLDVKVRFGDRSSITWSPAGDRLLVSNGYDLQLVTSMCTSVQQFSGSQGAFSPCSRYVCAAGDDVKICRAFDGAQVLKLTGSGFRRSTTTFDHFGDVLILSTPRRICILCFGWGSSPGTAYSRQLCSSLTAACRTADILEHSCCGWEC